MQNISVEMIRQMSGGFLDIDTVQESTSLVSERPFRVVLKHGYMNIGNLEALAGRGFKLLGFGVDSKNRLYIDFDVAGAF